MVDCHHDNLARRRSDEPIFYVGSGSADRRIRDHVFLYVACKAGSPGLSISAEYIGKPGMRGWVQTRQCSLVQLLKDLEPKLVLHQGRHATAMGRSGTPNLLHRYVIGPQLARSQTGERFPMNNLIWLVGAVVIVLAILSFFGFR
ncbi:hypothetical protein N1937_09605 [Rhizobium sp. WSM4643]|jgi:hypothetical protein|uniref:hypothetical protein n=1 Tax=Rhizobium sp. WSM4643 TaxID=3138253 RepID=UPI0021A96BCD|nr:hypothetical protein [Rhizobium leguminosarum]UWM77449.1 hypothetical protein N1937_09605 [Rhizobium leguminosarum bv. viciae]